MSEHRKWPTRRPQLQLESMDDRINPASLNPVSFNPYRIILEAPATTSPSTVIQQIQQVRGTAGAESLGQGLYRVNLGPGFTIASAQTQLTRLPGVQYVQPDYKIQLNQVPNAPRFADQWGLRNTGQSGGTAGADINAAAAWNVSTGTRQTIVAVIDTGVDYRHPDLAPNMWVNPREVAGNGKDDDGNGFVDDIYGANFMDNNGDPMDDYHHGTHVAGIIGAVGNNGIGVSGVNWNTRIMALKFMSANGGGFTSDAVRAVNYAVANGAKVINTSWGGAPYDNALVSAIKNARNSGVIVVASAGNDGKNADTDPFYPGSYSTVSDNVVSVAATDDRDQMPGYSNFGRNSVLLAAPGDNILSTFPNNSYSYLSGTSMATPMVSGALSLLWDARPDWSYQQVLAKLRTSVDTLPSLSGKTITGGRLDLAKLLDAPTVSPPAPPVTPPTTPPVTPLPPASTDRTPPRVVSAAFSGPRADTFDRVLLNLSEAMNLASLNSAITVMGPAGRLSISAILPLAGSNNSRFTLMLSRTQTSTGQYSLQVAATARDLAGNSLDQNNNGIGGQSGDLFTLTSRLGTTTSPPVTPPVTPPVSPPPVTPPTAPPSSTSRLNYSLLGGSRTILDRRTTRVDFLVTQNVRISDISLTLNISHARTSDLSIRLLAPDGTTISLFNRRGGSNLTNITFEDRATRTLSQGAAPFSGSFKPEQALSALTGKLAQGAWSLQIFDLVDGVSGTLNSANLSIGTNSSISTTTSQLNMAPPVEDAIRNGRPDIISLG